MLAFGSHHHLMVLVRFSREFPEGTTRDDDFLSLLAHSLSDTSYFSAIHLCTIQFVRHTFQERNDPVMIWHRALNSD